MTKIPSFITHYSRSTPFRSITSVQSERRHKVVAELDSSNAWGLGRFSDPEYLIRRLATERRLREEFIQLGGKPELENPIYFFLGRNPSFEEHEANRGYLIDLQHLSKEAVCFTYGDSLLAFDSDYRAQAGEKYTSPLCGKVFRLEDLSSLLSYPEFQGPAPLHIEAQLWTHPDPLVVQSLKAL